MFGRVCAVPVWSVVVVEFLLVVVITKAVVVVALVAVIKYFQIRTIYYVTTGKHGILFPRSRILVASRKTKKHPWHAN